MPPELKIPSNSEIDQALKEFEMGSSGGQIPKVPSAPVLENSEAPKMVRLVIKLSGGSLSEKQAEYVLFGFVIIIIIFSLFLIFKGGGSASKAPREALEQMKYIPSGQ